MTNERKFGLDLSRAIAIILVLVAHFVKDNFLAGFLGVEIFFALSGFLIGQILWRNFSEGEWNFKAIVNFWSRRWWRTLPNYYLFLVIFMVSHWVFDNRYLHFKGWLKFFWFGQNILERNSQFYSVSWSLAVEEFLYLLFPLVLLVLSKLIRSKEKAFLSTVAFFVIFCAAYREVIIHNGVIELARTLTLGRLDAIACGILTAFIFKSSEVKQKNIAGLIGGTLFAIPLMFDLILGIDLRNSEALRFLLFTTPLGVALSLPLVNTIKTNENILFRWIKNISLWSYSIYLSHIPIMKLCDYLIKEIVLSRMIALVLTFTVSALLFKLFEVPLTKLRPKELIAH